MDNNMGDHHYSSDEEEVFFGSLAGSEMLKRRRFLGSNYNSPVTPRAPRLNQVASGLQGSLPDVLSTAETSTPLQGELFAGSDDPNQAMDDSTDDIIVIDGSTLSNSVITLSDDESFLQNEESCLKNQSQGESADGATHDVIKTTAEPHCDMSSEYAHVPVSLKRSIINNSGIEIIKHDKSAAKDSTSEKGPTSVSDEYINLNVHDINSSEIGNDNGKSDNSSETNEIAANHKNSIFEKDFIPVCIMTGNQSLNESTTNKTENVNNACFNSSLTNYDSSVHEESKKIKDYSENISSLVQDIDEFVGDTSDYEGKDETKDESPIEQSDHEDKDESPIKQSDHEDKDESPIEQSDHEDKDESPIEPSSSMKDNDEDLYLSSSASCLGGTEPGAMSIALSMSKSPLPQQSEVMKSVNTAKEGNDTTSFKHVEHSFDISGLSNLRFSLSEVTDSILNISHGSSLPSPQETRQSEGCKPNLHEDINCEGQSYEIPNFEEISYQEDLHMSVDEVDFQRQRFTDNFDSNRFGNSNDISQQSADFNSCPSVHSSYSTAYACGESHSTSHQSNSFQNYRDVSTDLDFPPETDKVSIKSTEENPNVADFEIVLQNRQNSFNDTPVNTEKKSTNTSKLPVFQNAKSLLKPPKLHVKPDTLKSSSYKFAKQISHIGRVKTPSNLPKPEISKVPIPSTSKSYGSTTPTSKEKQKPTLMKATAPLTKIYTPKPKIQTPKQILSAKSNIPLLSSCKTPAQNIASKTPAKIRPATAGKKTPAQGSSGIPRVVNSDSKARRVLTPLSSMSETSTERFGRPNSAKSKYKNIISPIQAYIRGSPLVPQRKAQFISEEDESPEGQQEQSKNTSPVKSVSRVIQKLTFENVLGQENVNPNVIDPSRDTLPCKVLQPSLEVFWKEEEKPEHRLPKMGEKCTKILAPPQVKVTIHQGRVHQSPNTKGILVPNHDNSSSTENLNVASEQSDGRISVRIQKTMDLL